MREYNSPELTVVRTQMPDVILFSGKEDPLDSVPEEPNS